MIIKWKRLHAALDRRRKELDISWRQLGRDHNLTASTFTRMSQGKSLSAMNLVKVVNIIDTKSMFEIYYR